MVFSRQLLRRRLSFGALYLINFVFSFHFFFTIYFNSTFLEERGVEASLVGAVYVFGSILSIVALYLLPSLLNKIGNYLSLIAFAAVEGAIFVGLYIVESTMATVALFLIYPITYSLIVVSLDVFLENQTKREGRTGAIRGVFLTTTNTALIAAPLAAGLVLKTYPFETIYLVSAALVIPFIILISIFLRGFNDPKYEKLKIFSNYHELRERGDLRNILILHLFLRFFFTFMVIYTPIYLHTQIGFTLTEIGILSAIMLIPFALFEYPLGKIADLFFGEKEILFLGFILMIISTISLSFITSANFLLWASVLFLTRTGASAVEIMTESYFFKHVNGDDADNISIFRIMRPLGYIIGPTIGMLVLLFFDFQYLFLALGLLLLPSLLLTPKLKDSK
ncbi:MAG: MFS transporter [Parcubacteria group bacterium]|nr:MFS transporter [Parcubacteria group bacterium]